MRRSLQNLNPQEDTRGSHKEAERCNRGKPPGRKGKGNLCSLEGRVTVWYSGFCWMGWDPGAPMNSAPLGALQRHMAPRTSRTRVQLGSFISMLPKLESEQADTLEHFLDAQLSPGCACSYRDQALTPLIFKACSG